MRVIPKEIFVFLKFILLAKHTQTKSVHFHLEKCVKVKKNVIWHYVLRRDLGGLDAPALRWLWFGGHKCVALEGEGS